MKRIATLPGTVGLTAWLAAASLACTATAQIQIFSESFDTDHSLDNTWVTNTTSIRDVSGVITSGGFNPVDLFFDYSSVGIPPAPNSVGGTTRGLKLQANLDPGVQFFPAGSSASPSGFSIAQNFEMRWDWWLNFNGPLNGGGAGSTQIGGAGFGTAATSANVPTLIDSVFVGCSGDGAGTTADYRVYTPAFTASLQDPSGVYAAGTVGSRNNSHVYYQSTLPPQSATNNCPGQLALYPQQTGLTQGGSAGMRWNDISLKKVGNIITYTVNGLLIATIDVSTNGTLGGANIVFGQFDINAGASADVNATNLAFSLVDNIRITEFTNVVTVAATAPTASESGPTPGTFTITRTGVGAPLTVFYIMSGTAANGVDYTNALGGTLSGSVTFAATASETNITFIPVDDAIPEASDTVILAINQSLGQYVGAGSATITIADNEPPQLTVTNVSTQMYERTNDYATFRISRLGDLNAGSFSVNLSFAGTAGNGVDYYADSPASFDPGTQSQDIKVQPIEDSAYEGNETVTVNIAAAGGSEYTIGSPGAASITLVDATAPPATVLFSDDFNTDTSANWDLFVTSSDYTASFLFDYASQSIPPAPHGSGDTLGLFLSANKTAGAATAINLYPKTQSFSGNFALRFDMFLSVVVPNAVSTEYVLLGINHSGTKTNWFRSSPGGVPAGWTFDGVFYSIEADGAGLVAGNTSGGDYVNYSSPTTAGNHPTALSPGRIANSLANVFKVPPNSVLGVPGNNTALASPTPLWADVELSQIGKIITLRINNTPIFSYSNSTSYASGNIMIGYDDAFDSISLSSSYVVVDNVRVVRLTGLRITSFQDLGANVQVDFTFDLNDTASAFQVQGASAISGPYAAVAATIVQLTPGTYRATVTKSGGTQFYRIRHL